MSTSFGDRINLLMQDRKDTLRAVSRATGIPVSSLHNWILGTNPTDYHSVKRLAEYYGVSLSYLLCGESEPRVPVPRQEMHIGSELLIDGLVRMRIERLIPQNAEANTMNPNKS